MRFLKTKIARAEALLNQQQDQAQPRLDSSDVPQNEQSTDQRNTRPKRKSAEESQSRMRSQRLNSLANSSADDLRSTKNIAKNFGKAICNFSLSSVAAPYLEKILAKEKITVEYFKNFINYAKQKIDGLFSFRSVLMPAENESPAQIAVKNAFKQISEVFIKYFSVNWIFNGKMVHKRAHLFFRFKILRRIKSPELFTYLRKAGSKD